MIAAMKLLSFTVSNHKSIRDAQTLDLFSNWKASRTPDSGWDDYIHPATVIMGANASGKSNLLEALHFALTAVRLSATSWRSNGSGRQIYMPFALAEGYREKPSSYEIEFIADGIRYVYGFEWSYKGVRSEWLSRVPHKQWTMCFDRSTTEGRLEFNRSFMSITSQRQLGPISEEELILSVALRSHHPTLGPIAQALVDEVRYVPVGSVAMSQRQDYLIDLIRHGALDLAELSQLMIAADTGITKVELDSQRIPKKSLEQMDKVVRMLQDASGNSHEVKKEGTAEAAKFNDAELQTIVHRLVSTHRGVDGHKFELCEESTGTQNWLVTAPIFLATLRGGGVLIVDEIDSSLHQSLVELVVQAFTDPSINIHGAQLIFTSHNTNVLEHAQSLGLQPAALWFVEKTVDGATEIYPLADFPNHPNANYERRYLSGRYGALPKLSPSTLRALVAKESA